MEVIWLKPMEQMNALFSLFEFYHYCPFSQSMGSAHIRRYLFHFGRVISSILLPVFYRPEWKEGDKKEKEKNFG